MIRARRNKRDAFLQQAERQNARMSFFNEADASWDAFQENGLHLTGDEVSAWLKTVGTDCEAELPEAHR